MNKAFKSIWSDARQSFVTTSEIQCSHGKRSKTSVSLGVAAVLLAAGGLASAAYVETGVLGAQGILGRLLNITITGA